MMPDTKGSVVIAPPLVEKGYVTTKSNWWSVDEYEQTPELRWPLSIDVYDRMRRTDAQVASTLRAVTLPILRTKWWIDPAGARDEVVEQIAVDLGLPIKGADPIPSRARDRFSWPDHLRLSLLDLTFGHMFFEQVVRLDDRGRVRLRKLGPRMPRTIVAVNVDDDGGLVSIEQAAGATKVIIPVDRLVAYVHDREGGNWFGSSLLRPAYKHWIVKDRLLRVQAQTIDRNGMGVPRYTGAEGEPDLDRGQELAVKWRSGENAGASIPFGAKLDLVGVSGSLPDAMPAIRYHDEQMARNVLGHVFNLGQQTGSWALGDVFGNIFTSSLQSVGEQKRDVFQQHVIEDLVDWNWGPDEPVPQLGFDEIGADKKSLIEALKLLVDGGLVFPDRVLEETVRQILGVPPKALPPPAPTTEAA